MAYQWCPQLTDLLRERRFSTPRAVVLTNGSPPAGERRRRRTRGHRVQDRGPRRQTERRGRDVPDRFPIVAEPTGPRRSALRRVGTRDDARRSPRRNGSTNLRARTGIAERAPPGIRVEARSSGQQHPGATAVADTVLGLRGVDAALFDRRFLDVRRPTGVCAAHVARVFPSPSPILRAICWIWWVCSRLTATIMSERTANISNWTPNSTADPREERDNFVGDAPDEPLVGDVGGQAEARERAQRAHAAEVEQRVVRLGHLVQREDDVGPVAERPQIRLGVLRPGFVGDGDDRGP